MLNEVLLLGCVANEIYVNGEVCKITLATKIGYDKENNKDRVAFVPVTVFRLSVAQRELVKKGKLLLVKAIVKQNNYEKDGEKIYTTEVICQKGGLTFVN